MPWPKREEQAILQVNGRDFKDWESVLVHHEQGGKPPYYAKFTCSEGLPLSKNVAVMQIKPGDFCTITLAGLPAFSGYVHTRQAYVDGHRHSVEIQCATFMNIMEGSVIFQGIELKNKTLGEATRKVLDPLGIKTVFENGAEPTAKFPRLSPMHSEPIYDWLDMISRATPTESGLGIRITSNPKGDFVYVMNASNASDEVVEGRNMLVGRELIFNPSVASSYPSLGQGTGNDKDHGAKVAHIPFLEGTMNLSPFSNGMPVRTVVNELATSDQNVLQGRNSNEGGWSAGDEITVVVTVYGWLRPSGGLWDRNQHVVVTAPTLMMKGEKLKMKSVTFTQTNQGGTRTDLKLCNDAARRGGQADIR